MLLSRYLKKYLILYNNFGTVRKISMVDLIYFFSDFDCYFFYLYMIHCNNIRILAEENYFRNTTLNKLL